MMQRVLVVPWSIDATKSPKSDSCPRSVQRPSWPTRPGSGGATPRSDCIVIEAHPEN
jgi:hypothetical protein